jgi:hypothetical protein
MANKNLPNYSLTVDCATKLGLFPHLPEITNIDRAKREEFIIANGSKMATEGEGNCQIFEGKKPMTVSISSSAQEPLLSVGDICTDYGMSVIEDDQGVRFVKGRIHIPCERIKGEGPYIRGLYRFNPAKPLGGVPAYAKCLTKNTTTITTVPDESAEAIFPTADDFDEQIRQEGLEPPDPKPAIDLKIDPDPDDLGGSNHMRKEPNAESDKEEENLEGIRQQLAEIRQLLLKAQVAVLQTKRKKRVRLLGQKRGIHLAPKVRTPKQIARNAQSWSDEGTGPRPNYLENHQRALSPLYRRQIKEEELRRRDGSRRMVTGTITPHGRSVHGSPIAGW